jgi:signal transduction histidine kinase/DNA-binding response OmpR family regulator
MIELGQIRLQHQSSVYDARSKIRGLANALGYDPIEATRLTTAVSEAARELCDRNREPRISVALAMEFSPPQLVLDFENRGEPPELLGIAGFFDRLSRSSTEDGFQGVRALKGLPRPSFEATDEFVTEQRGRIQNLSREELMAEIQGKNRELEQHSAELETIVAQRTDELKEAVQAAQDASRAKSSFLANMSHELRTPMNAIIGYSEMLMEDAEDAGNEGTAADLGKIHAAGRHLLSLINDVLDLSKIEAGKMDLYLETFEVGPMIQEVVSTIDTLIAKNSNELVLDIDESLVSMRADLTKIRQGLFNLLSNAAKFTHEGRVTLRVAREERDGTDWAIFSVTDTGIGIPPEKIGHVFDEFSQADESTTRNFGGTGLGLAITKRFCQMMGGDVLLESTVGVGSCFSIHVPVKVEDSEAKEVEAAAVAKAAEEIAEVRSVLVIDDDPNALDLLGRTLGGAGYRVVTASDGQEALRLAKTLRPSAITLDVIMPGMDGWAVLRELKTDPETRDIPVIMVTMTDDRDMGLALGATEFLTKPIERDQLVSLLARYQSLDAGGHVLVVDDNEEVRAMLRRALEKEGWGVDEAENGRVALERIEAREPALILLDLMMPVMDGFEFVMEMRHRGAAAAIPIVVVTAKDLTDEDRERLNGDVAALVQKGGSNRDDFLAEIRDLVASTGTAD